jgi:hypothetical protein
MTQDAGTRRLDSWIERFVEYTDGLSSPERFRRWGAINALAGLLERRVWVVTRKRQLFANLFTLLIGPPGVGKTEILREVSALWNEIKDLPGGRKLHVAPDDLTKAALVKQLAKATTRLVLSDVELVEYHSLLASVAEFSVFLPTYDTVFMSVLTDLFDCRDNYNQSRAGEGDTFIPSPQLHMVAGTTPGFMSTTFPEQAWSMGFSSRLILVYAGEPVDTPLFNETSLDKKLWMDLVHDARVIAQSYGQLSWTPKAQELIQGWVTLGCQPVPTHPKLSTYNTRRTLQVIKLCIIACVSRTSEMLITEDDVTTAIAWLLEVEQYMPDIFKDMSSGGGGSVLLDLHHWAMGLCQKEKRDWVQQGRIVNFVAQKTQYPHQVMPILTLAVKNGMFRIEDDKWYPLGGQ